MNKLYFGDCLHVLRNEIPDESVDLVYLDPPFNSNRNYNLLFKAPTGHQSEAQISAFEDTWRWGDQAEREFRDILHQSQTKTSELITAFRGFLGENDLMAYLVMMVSRLLELHRVLKPSGSIYLHCDPTASHYLKLLMDAVFGIENYRNDIVWKRANAHNDPKRYGRITDSILYYSKTENPIWNTQFTEYREDYYKTHFKQDENNRYHRTVPLDAPRHGKGSPALLYEWNGKLPAPSRTWAVKYETMQRYEAEGRIRYTKTGTPTLIQYADKMQGVQLQNIWTDIPPVNPQARERLGYPTQKPQALLERIITASSNEGSIVLDPFCGCGTAVHAAQKLSRQWIGIDITHLAISLIEKRLRDAFPGIEFIVHGTPKDFDGARNLATRDKYQFQWWACSLVNAQPWQDKKKGADRGIDGIIYFQDEKGIPKKIIVSVKGGDNIGRAMIADLKNSVEREKAQIGLFVTLVAPTKEMVKEALTAGYYESPYFRSSEYPKIQILTIEGLLNGSQRPHFPDLSQGAYTFRKATHELEVANPKQDFFSRSE